MGPEAAGIVTSGRRPLIKGFFAALRLIVRIELGCHNSANCGWRKRRIFHLSSGFGEFPEADNPPSYVSVNLINSNGANAFNDAIISLGCALMLSPYLCGQSSAIVATNESCQPTL